MDRLDQALGGLFDMLENEQRHVVKKDIYPPIIKTTRDLVQRYAEKEVPEINHCRKGESFISCKPWNYEDFQSRLKSFSKLKDWFAKAPELSPIQCARHGWANIGPNTLKCYACDALLADNSSGISFFLLTIVLQVYNIFPCNSRKRQQKQCRASFIVDVQSCRILWLAISVKRSNVFVHTEYISI